MRHYQIIHEGLIYCADEYATSKRAAISQYRQRWNLQNKRVNLKIWEV